MTNPHFGVFIGRFTPFHNGHHEVVKEALQRVDELIIVVGSDKGSRDTRNPLTTSERIAIIQAALHDLSQEFIDRVRITSVPDFPYNNDAWIAAVQGAVFSSIHSKNFISGPYSVSLVGMKKDESSYYLNMFPMWKSIDIPKPEFIISATNIRDDYFKGVWNRHMSTNALQTFITFMEPIKEQLLKDWQYEQTYEDIWGKGPHFTVDACVVQSGHVLLIQRGAEYGHQKWALPGGFINRNETTLDATIRELQEETKIKVPEKVLIGSIKKRELFDDPHRSNRSRIITHASYIRLEDMNSFPKVKGSDDAIDAAWVPLSKVKNMRSNMFEDHYHIINSLVQTF